MAASMKFELATRRLEGAAPSVQAGLDSQFSRAELRD